MSGRIVSHGKADQAWIEPCSFKGLPQRLLFVQVITPSGREGKSAEEGKFVAKERSGHVKEYIEEEGLGMIIDKELGLVLFHLSTVWLGGTLCTDPQRAKTSLCLGSEVSYVVRSFQGEDYGCISADRVLHQVIYTACQRQF